jgi:uncharacterized protein (UPF0179 family)
MTPASVKVQIIPESVPSTPSWLGEVAIVDHVFTQRELFQAIAERVRFARARFGTYDVIDFTVVLLGYAVSGEQTLEEFYERLEPFGEVFMGLFERARLPSRSALSRYLSALDKPAVEALRTLFQEDLGARPALGPGGLRDREGKRWVVIDVDATKEAARQRALPRTPELPAPHRRMDLVCAPGYTGRKRGEVVRSRTTVLQAHTQNWLGTFSGAGNGDYRGELLRAIEVITNYAQAQSLPLSSILIRLDGLYGNAAPLIDILTAKLGMIVRGKDYALLDLPSVQARLALPPDEWTTHPESGASRALFNCLDVPLTPVGPLVRMIVATHSATPIPAPIGMTRKGLVYEIFLTTASPQALTPSDVLHLYLHRGSFETVLAKEDQEQDPDRWVSRTPCGQEFWQILSQWVWNIRIELGQQLTPVPMRLTELVPAGVVLSPSSAPPVQTVASLPTDEPIEGGASAPTRGMAQATPLVEYGPPMFSDSSPTTGFAGSAFSVQPDGTLLCPAGQPLYPQERRLQRNGSLRIIYAARIGHCRSCPLRLQCQGARSSQARPRRVSAICQPLPSSCPSLAAETVAVDGTPAPIEPTPALLEPTATTLEVEIGGTSAPMGSALALLEPVSPTVAAAGNGTSAPIEPAPPLVSPAISSESPINLVAFAPMGELAQATPPVLYGPPKFAHFASTAGFAGSAFSLQPDGTLRCPSGRSLYPHERRLQSNGSLRIIYAARISDCRSCSLRPQCQGSCNSLVGPRRVSAVCQPLSPSATVAAAVDDSPIEPAPPLVSPPISSEGPINLVACAPTGELAQATPLVEYGPPTFSDSSSTAGFAGSAFSLQPDGTLLCPAGQPLYPHERRLQPNGSLRIVYAARIWHCRSCPLRLQCQGPSSGQARPRRVSAICQPLSSSPAATAESGMRALTSPSPLMESAPPASTTVEAGSVEIDGSSASIELAPTSATVEDRAVQIERSSPLMESAPPASTTVEAGSVEVDGSSASIELAPTSATVEDRAVQIERSSPLMESAPPASTTVEAGSVEVDGSSASIELAPTSATVEDRAVQIERSSPLMESAPPASTTVEAGSVEVDGSSASIELAPTSATVEDRAVQIERSSLAIESPATLVDQFSSPTSCPVLWEDWPASQIRRRWLKLLRTETVLLTIGPTPAEVQTDDPEQRVLTRAQRAHWRLSWSERLARNARGSLAPALSVTIHGLPASFAMAFALDIAA